LNSPMTDDHHTQPLNAAAIIVAAGSARRMGFDKLSADLLGKSVLQRSVEAFVSSPAIQKVVVVSTEARFDALDHSSFAKEVVRVNGGQERQDSVFNGMRELGEDFDYVAVHDGARPLISVEQIERTLLAAEKHQAAASARVVTETLKRACEDDFSREAVSREQLWIMETPQSFDLNALRKAYEYVQAQGLVVTDEVSAMEAVDIPTKLVKNAVINTKLTYPEDFELARLVIQNRD